MAVAICAPILELWGVAVTLAAACNATAGVDGRQNLVVKLTTTIARHQQPQAAVGRSELRLRWRALQPNNIETRRVVAPAAQISRSPKSG